MTSRSNGAKDAHIRALGVALPYAIANTMFGGTAEFVALKFKDAGIERGFYIYVTVMIAISLVSDKPALRTRSPFGPAKRQ